MNKKFLNLILNYKKVCGDDPKYKKDPANFFQKTDKYFIDYLPESFKDPNETPEPEEPSIEELTS